MELRIAARRIVWVRTIGRGVLMPEVTVDVILDLIAERLGEIETDVAQLKDNVNDINAHIDELRDVVIDIQEGILHIIKTVDQTVAEFGTTTEG
jgi:methyl-accepting chemotaxis protein